MYLKLVSELCSISPILKIILLLHKYNIYIYIFFKGFQINIKYNINAAYVYSNVTYILRTLKLQCTYVYLYIKKRNVVIIFH